MEPCLNDFKLLDDKINSGAKEWVGEDEELALKLYTHVEQSLGVIKGRARALSVADVAQLEHDARDLHNRYTALQKAFIENLVMPEQQDAFKALEAKFPVIEAKVMEGPCYKRKQAPVGIVQLFNMAAKAQPGFAKVGFIRRLCCCLNVMPFIGGRGGGSMSLV